MPEPDSNVWKWIATSCLGALAMVIGFWFVNGNSVVMQQQRMGDQISALQQRVSDLQKTVEVDQAHDIKLDHDSITQMDERVHLIMDELPSLSYADRPRQSAPPKKN